MKRIVLATMLLAMPALAEQPPTMRIAGQPATICAQFDYRVMPGHKLTQAGVTAANAAFAQFLDGAAKCGEAK